MLLNHWFSVAVNRKLWIVLLKKLGLNPIHVIEGNLEMIMNSLTSQHDISVNNRYLLAGSAWKKIHEGATHLALKSLFSLHPSSIQPLITKYAVAIFNSYDVVNATKEDYEIMVTKPNQLYHLGLKKQYVHEISI